jgi:GAF domain-containing protein
VREGVGVPLLRDGKVEGVIALSRYTPGLYSQRQIDLVQTFADQAVIAIENVRLFDEVQARTRDLEESLAQQTATAEVLKVISRSAFDLQRVLETLIESAVRLIGAFRGAICLRDGDVYPFRAIYGEKPELAAWLREHPATVGRGSIVGRVALTGEVEQISDVHEDREHLVPAEDYRSLIGVPLQRNGETAGVLVVVREAAGAFNRRQVELLQTFADQPSGDRARERPAVRRGAGAHQGSHRGAAAADRDSRSAEGHQPLGVRPAARVRFARVIGGRALQRP